MSDLIFEEPVFWDGAIFKDGCVVSRCKFNSGLYIGFATFERGPGSFRDCTIDRLYAHFCNAGQWQYVNFSSCIISGDVDAEGAQTDFRLVDCKLSKSCDLSRASARCLFLCGSLFDGELRLADVEVDDLYAAGIDASVASVIGPLRINNSADLSSARFRRRVRVMVSGPSVSLAGATFDGGGRIECKRATVDLSDLVVGGPLSISGDEGSSVLAIQNADCGRLTLSSVDLSACRFYGCHDLQGIVLEPTVRLPRAPGLLRARRRCIADEFAWRSAKARGRAKAWSKALGAEGDRQDAPRQIESEWSRAARARDKRQGASLLTEGRELGPAEVAGVYRSLRKSVEAQSDEPGACDYYYGEMEMRRWDPTKSWWERAIIWAYWLVSGYGLRGSRSFFWLLCSLLVGSVLMEAFGLKGRHSWAVSVVAAAQSLVPGLRVSAQLTNNGEVFEIFLKIAGPVLLGLTALALRNRIRR